MPEAEVRRIVPARPDQPVVLLIGSYDDGFMRFMSEPRGYGVDFILDSGQAVAAAGGLRFDVVVTGLRIGPADGLEVLRAFRAVDPDAPVIMSTHETSPRKVVEVMQAGAFDYVVEPYEDLTLVGAVLERALARRRTLLEATRLRRELQAQSEVPEIVGRSGAVRRLREEVRRAADASSPVLITGASGTGKGLVARAIHGAGRRRSGPFVIVNCGAIPEQLFESELFGHVRGAFTGAVADRQGRVQQSDTGTLFLDEIAELSPGAQVKLLRFIEEHQFEKVGDSRQLSADVRILCATNRNLPERIASGLFREDLFYRVNVLCIDVPPLRERREDVPLLAQHFLEEMAAESGKAVRAISREALAALCERDWPGNARQLRNVLERAFVFSSGDTILPRDLPVEPAAAAPAGTGRGQSDEPRGLRQRLLREERRLIVEALEGCGWVRSKAAERLAIPRSTLMRRMRELDITR
jgi:DNA-binding NtrC family response regulator